MNCTTLVKPQHQSQVTKSENYQLIGQWLKVDGKLICRWIHIPNY